MGLKYLKDELWLLQKCRVTEGPVFEDVRAISSLNSVLNMLSAPLKQRATRFSNVGAFLRPILLTNLTTRRINY